MKIEKLLETNKNKTQHTEPYMIPQIAIMKVYRSEYVEKYPNNITPYIV